MEEKESLLRSKDVAHILDCCPDDVMELARTKQLKGTKQGRYWRFNLTDIKAYRKRNAGQS